MLETTAHQLDVDVALRRRAQRVIPGGMYGHQRTATLPEGYPQFLERGLGSRIWDVDGNEYIDLMCSYGPIILGHAHPAVDAAAAAQQARADCQNSPSARIVELAELLADTVAHADWAMFAKNGTDATTLCATIARATTGKKKVLVAKGAYHGAAPWCTPNRTGTTPEDRANLVRFTFNDLASAQAAADAAGDDLAAVLVSPFRHDAGFDQELTDPAFARGLRDLCDRREAALILDDVRCGFRLDLAGSWEPLGVRPDLSAWSKAIANGYPLAAVLGNDRFRDGATRVFTTGSFWFASVPMAAAIATIGVLRDSDAVAHMERIGRLLRAGLQEQADSYGVAMSQTGPVQMPFLSFAGDTSFERAKTWTGETIRRGVYVHPWHNWFMSTALTEDDVSQALAATDDAFAAVRREFGAD